MLDSPLEEIKSRLDIVDVLSEYVQLTQAGVNFKAKCPFHQEKTPSFIVSPEKQIWHCFGCGLGGDIFTFVMKIDGVEFPEALRTLAVKAGVQLKQRNPEQVNRQTRLLDLTQLATNYFHKVLLDSKKAQPVRDYLNKRGIKLAIIKDFKLGFAPDFFDDLSKLLIKKGYQEQEIVMAGLGIKRDNGQLIDRFRDRLMFPISDVHSNVIGFGGRILQDNSKFAKYINTPQTTIYDKSRVVYALDKAKNSIREKKVAVIVEGYMDVLASHQVGITNVVASSGTALTLEQLKLLKRYTNNLVISFDTDLAGETATERGINLALQQGFEIKIIDLPFGKDPDECIKKDPKLWQKAIDSAVSIMDYYFKKTLAKYDVKQAEGRSQIAKILLTVIAQLADKVQQNYYIQQLSEILETPENILYEQLTTLLNKQIINSNKQAVSVIGSPVIKDRYLLLSEQLLAVALKFPEHLEYIINHFKPEVLVGQRNQQLYKDLIICYTNQQAVKQNGKDFCQELKKTVEQAKQDYIDILNLLAEKDFVDFSAITVKEEILKIIKHLNNHYITQQRQFLGRQMKQAEKSGRQEEINELTKKFNQLINGL